MSDQIKLPDGSAIFIQGDNKDVSDGHHSFGELYEHRILLFIALMKSHPDLSWKSLRHHDIDQPMFGDSFIAGMELNGQQITYHIPISYWQLCDVQCLPRAKPWDGHTSFDTLERLLEWIPTL